jgi:hypothetical protein
MKFPFSKTEEELKDPQKEWGVSFVDTEEPKEEEPKQEEND